MNEKFREERRRGPDVWVKSIRWLAISGWILMGLSIFLFDEAKPEFETFFDRWFDISLRLHWNQTIAILSFLSFQICFFTSIAALVINRNRHRRKTDEYRINLIILAGIALLGMGGLWFVVM